jgi:hypothetical protein
VAIISILTLTSCASSQVNYNTLDIASTYDQLITKQVTFNLRKTYENPYGIPAFVKVSNQTATTQNSITPTFTLPLTDQITTALCPYQAKAGCATSTGSRRTRLAPLGIVPDLSWS